MLAASLNAFFLCFSHLRLRRRFHVSAGRYRQQRGNTSCEAANRRNEKKALSEAASFFPFRLPLRGLKGASSPFLVDPARRNRWCFSGSLLTSKENISLNEKALYPAPPARRKLENTKTLRSLPEKPEGQQRLKAAAECGASLPSARGCWRQHPAQRPALRPAPRRCSCAA